MTGRAIDLAALVQEVRQGFRGLPDCPRSLSVAADALGNICVVVFERRFVISGWVLTDGFADADWCRQVLHKALAVPSLLRVHELALRTEMATSLTDAELQIMRDIRSSWAIRYTDGACVRVCKMLVEKQMLEPRPGSRGDHPSYQLTEHGTIALDARQG